MTAICCGTGRFSCTFSFFFRVNSPNLFPPRFCPSCGENPPHFMQKGDEYRRPRCTLARAAKQRIKFRFACKSYPHGRVSFRNPSHCLARRRPPLRGGIQQRRSRRSKTRDMRVGFATPTQPPWAASLGYHRVVSSEPLCVYRGILNSPIKRSVRCSSSVPRPCRRSAGGAGSRRGTGESPPSCAHAGGRAGYRACR